MLGHDIRSTSVHEQMLLTWKNFFEVKIVSKAEMDSKYQHPSIQLFIIGLKPPPVTADNAVSTEKQEKTDWGIDHQVNKTKSGSSVDYISQCRDSLMGSLVNGTREDMA